MAGMHSNIRNGLKKTERNCVRMDAGMPVFRPRNDAICILCHID